MSGDGAGPVWAELAARIRACTRCAELAATRTQVVVGVAPPGASVLLIGEAPGAAEDASGIPFVGRAGQLLDELLAGAGLARPTVAVANVLKCRPPGNRRPTGVEIANCRPWLERQITLIEPTAICALGLTAATWALGRRTTLKQARGQVHELGGRPLVISYHPSAAIRFGPAGEPRRALAEDLSTLAALVAR